MNSFEIVRELLLRFAEVDRSTADEKTLLQVNRFSLVIFSSGIHKERRSRRPDLLEADLDAIQKLDLPDFCGERLAHFLGLSLEGDGALEAER